ncbi:hypothetical protein PINS_up006115 [Pythium insidiosum]|nr:hypothetical protein PINS_up006115 [Pythium insidiosum]
MEALAHEVRNALDPQSVFLKIWHQVLLLGVLYDAFIIPFLITFKPHAGSTAALTESPELVAFYAVELVFCLDIWVRLNTGYYEEGSVHRDVRHARRKYMRSWGFTADIVSLIPCSLLPVNLSTSKLVLELHKIFRLWRMPKYLSNLDDVYAVHFETLKLTKTVVSVLLLSHYLACVRFSFGYDESGKNHWLPEPPHDHDSPRRQYIMSEFWAFGMLMGLYEGELPHAIGEFLFTLCVMFCGFMVFTALCSTLFMLSKCDVGYRESAEAKINQLVQVMSYHSVPDELQHRAVDYLKVWSV